MKLGRRFTVDEMKFPHEAESAIVAASGREVKSMEDIYAELFGAGEEELPMKVMKPGRPVVPWSEEYECSGYGNGGSGCGAVLLVEEGDLFETQSNCRAETTYYLTFTCPCCCVKTDILKAADVPLAVRERVSRRAKD